MSYSPAAAPGLPRNVYRNVFGYCAGAAIVAWGVMKLLVPKFKKIES